MRSLRDWSSDVGSSDLGVTERVLAQLTELERRALSEALPVDGAALRATAALRWRIAAVLEHARSAGSAPDADAARALPAEIDAALGALKALARRARRRAARDRGRPERA